MAHQIKKYNLPLNVSYKIIETFTTEDFVTCENCGKPLKNVAVVESSSNHKYYIGLDCAHTLQGITQDTIDYWNDEFNQAKQIRAKINRNRKKYDETEIHAFNTYDEMDKITIYCYSSNKGDNRNFWFGETVTLDFCKRMLPEIFKIAKINTTYRPIDPKKETLFDENHLTFKNYVFDVKMKGKKLINIDMYDNRCLNKIISSQYITSIDNLNETTIDMINTYEFNKGRKIQIIN